MSDEAQTIPADPGKQRQALIAAAVMAVIGVLGYYAIDAQVAQINLALDGDDHELAIWLTRRMGAVILGCLMLAGVGLAYTLEKVTRMSLQQGRYPPEGVSVLQRTQIRVGASMKRIVLGLRVCAVLLLLVCGGLSAWFSVLLYRLF